MPKFGWIPDLPDERDLQYPVAPKLLSFFKKLPTSVDLRDKMPLVYDQRELGSCTAQAGCAVLMYCEMLSDTPDVERSRLELYWRTRYLEHTVNQDAGAQIRDTFKAMNKFGVAPESLWPYDISKFTQTPPDNVTGADFRLTEYRRVPNSVQGLKEALADEHPVVIGINIYSSFMGEQAQETGVIPIPDKSKEELLGGHAIVIVGYNTASDKQWFVFRNSWGEIWGENGYGYLPFAYLKGNASDFWTALKY
jgi:C1A family cysteine protease